MERRRRNFKRRRILTVLSSLSLQSLPGGGIKGDKGKGVKNWSGQERLSKGIACLSNLSTLWGRGEKRIRHRITCTNAMVPNLSGFMDRQGGGGWLAQMELGVCTLPLLTQVEMCALTRHFGSPVLNGLQPGTGPQLRGCGPLF